MNGKWSKTYATRRGVQGSIMRGKQASYKEGVLEKYINRIK